MAIRNLCDSLGEMRIFNQFHKANFYAESLAKLGHRMQLVLHTFDSLPSCISLAFHVDVSGITHARVKKKKYLTASI